MLSLRSLHGDSCCFSNSAARTIPDTAQVIIGFIDNFNHGPDSLREVDSSLDDRSISMTSRSGLLGTPLTASPAESPAMVLW
jgi:hypothetical protein